MSALLALAIAAIQQVGPAPGPDIVAGPFVISSEVTPPEGFPYPTSFRLTHLKWRSSDGLVTYDLSDTGDTVSITYAVGVAPRDCLGQSSPYRLGAKPADLFNEEMFVGAGCASATSAAQKVALRKEIRAVRGSFAQGYRLFVARTLQQHGPSRRRCRELGTGYHGPVCQRYWDEAKAPGSGGPIGGNGAAIAGTTAASCSGRGSYPIACVAWSSRGCRRRS